MPDLAEATERAGTLDLVDAVATALLRGVPGTRREHWKPRRGCCAGGSRTG
ncbi:hypothetical protein LUX01_02575 [Streptomyces sudanensis]|uniref:hypothetical protein n=1 Tax=Streptomyces sudanensis TaxID=436397 RepID=UPI0020CD00F3|nr:hypothetical protein [Streptomyces sudanensis]MCP9985745.1 hypothetical protein [Streptomyces sudanensis]